MKKAAYITTVTSIILILASFLFMLNHMAGRGWLLVVGLFILVVIALPLSVTYMIRSKMASLNIFGVVSFNILVAGVAFKIQNWGGGGPLIASIGIVLFGIFIILFVRYRNLIEQKKETEFKHQVLEDEMKALRSQMNPHFIFNSLNSIQTYILQNDTENAVDYLSKFSKLMRLILENSRLKLIPLQQDLEALELYIELEQLRFEKKFSCEVKVADGINSYDTMVPPLMLQPFVENSIRHGLLSKGEEGKLYIGISEKNNMLYCVIEDNGAGRSKTEPEHTGIKERKSLGLTITKERLEIINHIEQSKSTFEITDLNDNGTINGTKVELMMPLVYSNI